MTAYDLAMRFVGLKEVEGATSNPAILTMLQLDASFPTDDAVPWCSAFMNFIAWLMRLPRSKSLAARSWLQVGTPIQLEEAKPGWDVVIFNRGGSPDPDVPGLGHVAFFASLEGDKVRVIGGNQSDSVGMGRFPVSDVLGVRRLRAL